MLPTPTSHPASYNGCVCECLCEWVCVFWHHHLIKHSVPFFTFYLAHAFVHSYFLVCHGHCAFILFSHRNWCCIVNPFISYIFIMKTHSYIIIRRKRWNETFIFRKRSEVKSSILLCCAALHKIITTLHVRIRVGYVGKVNEMKRGWKWRAAKKKR